MKMKTINDIPYISKKQQVIMNLLLFYVLLFNYFFSLAFSAFLLFT